MQKIVLLDEWFSIKTENGDYIKLEKPCNWRTALPIFSKFPFNYDLQGRNHGKILGEAKPIMGGHNLSQLVVIELMYLKI